MKLFRTLELARRHIGSFARHNSIVKMRNAMAIYWQFLLKKEKINGYPVEMIIDPINVCNLHCPLCVTGQRANKRPFGKMPMDDFERILDEVGRWLYKLRFYSWGEPLLHEDIYSMIAMAAERNISTEMSSNFLKFQSSDAGKMIDSGLELLIISMDGATEQTYKHYRQGGDFQRLVENVRALTDAKKEAGSRFPTVELQLIAMRHNEHEIDDMERMANELGADKFRVVPVTLNTKDPGQVENWLPQSQRLSRYDYKTLDDKIYTRRGTCPWLWRSAVVNWDCTMSPCCVFEGPKSEMGSLVANSFLEVWNNESYQAARGVFNRDRTGAAKPNICTRCKGVPNAGDSDQQGLY
jgi:MoaA/NifB/PqqE/SkfB family radical SAM enzyme